MKSLKYVVLFGALSLVFMGCPYETKVPVDDISKSKIDKSLLGKWDEKSSEDYLWTVTQDGNEYRIEKMNIKEGGDPTIYKGFLSDVNGVSFLNLYEYSADGSSSDRQYYIYRIEKKGEGRVKARGVTSNITETFATSAELKDFIKKYMELSFFYDSSEEKSFYIHD